MLNAIIVDDERRTRDILLTRLPWKQIGFDSVKTAENGVAALALVENEQPDLILTDIRMPKMDGITLAGRVRARYPRCKLVFLTAYTDKELLKSAIRVQAVDYVEKPLELEEIERVIRRAQEEIVALDSLTFRKTESEYRALAVALCDRRYAGEPLSQRAARLGFPGPATFVTVLAVSDRSDAALLEPSLSAVARGIDARMISALSSSDASTLIAHFRLASPEQAAHLRVAVRTAVEKARGTPTSFFATVGNAVSSLSEIAISYDEARSSAARRFFADEHSVRQTGRLLGRAHGSVPVRHTDQSSDHSAAAEGQSGGPCAFDDEFPAALLESLQAGMVDRAHAAVAAFHADAVGCGPMHVARARSMMDSVLDLMRRFAEERRLPWDRFHENSGLDLGARTEPWELAGFFPTVRHFRAYADRLIDWMGEKSTKPNDTASEIRDFIIAHLSDHELGVGLIARRFLYTPSYVCSVFKRGTGRTVNRFITSKRVELAKSILRKSDELMQDAARMVGYDDPKYFTKVFKKEVGCTPTEYRRKIRPPE